MSCGTPTARAALTERGSDLVCPACLYAEASAAWSHQTLAPAPVVTSASWIVAALDGPGVAEAPRSESPAPAKRPAKERAAGLGIAVVDVPRRRKRP